MRLKVLTSHPVQYHVPYIRELVASGIDVEVGFYHQGTAGKIGHDEGFGINIEWDIDLLSGYKNKIFLKDRASYSLLEQIKIASQLLWWALHDRQTPLLLIGWFAHIVWLVWLLRLLCGMKVLVLSENTPMSAAISAKPGFRRNLLRHLLQRSSACLFIGQRNREFYLSYGVLENRLFHVPYSIDNERFSQMQQELMAQRSSLCEKYSLDPQLPTFLFCGKLIEKKRPLQLLNAYLHAGLKDKAQLIFVGEGILRAKLEAKVKHENAHNVHFLGFLNQSQMPLAYVLGELLCLISESTETLGLVVNEAMACSRPVIVAGTVGCSVDLVQDDNGWIVALDDLGGVTKTLRIAYEHYADWPKMGNKGYLRIQNNSFQAMVKGTNKAISE